MQVKANGINIEVEDTGAGGSQPDAPVILLIMGLGEQLVAWPAAFIQSLADQGFRVVRFDNRDIGLSQHLDHLPAPNPVWQTLKSRVGLPLRPPYTLKEMAGDALGVLDALGIARAHVVGVSMGGMIAQRMALAAPHRVLSLCSVMSSSGARNLPGPTARALRALLRQPKQADEQAVVDYYTRLFKVIGSPAFPLDEGALRDVVLTSLRRSFYPAGTLRQVAAVAADSHRAKELAGIKTPTLVVHGKDDPLMPFACGADTARRIQGAQLVGIHGMGHDLAPGVVARLLEALLSHIRCACPA